MLAVPDVDAVRRHREDGEVCGALEDVQGLVLASLGSAGTSPRRGRSRRVIERRPDRENLGCGAVGALGQIGVSQTFEHLRKRAPGMTHVNSRSALE